jgi:hypothetical protein
MLFLDRYLKIINYIEIFNRFFCTLIPFHATKVYPDVEKTGGLQSQGAKGASVVVYCKPLATMDLEPSGFPEG